jgi:hypothetical protein
LLAGELAQAVAALIAVKKSSNIPLAIPNTKGINRKRKHPNWNRRKIPSPAIFLK